MGMFTFWVLISSTFLGHIWSENSKVKFESFFKVKFDISTDSNMQNSMVVFAASVLDFKYLFWTSLVEK